MLLVKWLGIIYVLLTEALAIREDFVGAIQKQMEQIIIESDSPITVKAINENPPKLIENIVEDCKTLPKTVKNIKFVYNWSTNMSVKKGPFWLYLMLFILIKLSLKK